MSSRFFQNVDDPVKNDLLESFIKNRKRRLTESLTESLSGQKLYFTKRCKMYLQYLYKIEKETLNNEYKELEELNISLSKDILEGKFMGNEMIIQSIYNILKKNLLKYLVSCLHSQSKISLYEMCSLMIGIQDDGTVLGIPFLNTLEPSIVIKMIHDIINEFLICDQYLKENIKKIITVDIIDVDIGHQKPKITLFEQLEKCKEAIQILEDHKTENKRKMDEWKKLLDITKTKLSVLYLQEWSRQKIIEFAKRNGVPEHVLTILEDRNNILDMKNEMITANKYDKSTPYYYICSWRDEETEIVLKQKPVPIPLPNIKFERPDKLVKKLINMIPLWLEKEDRLKLHVIKISFSKEYNIDLTYVDIRGRIRSCFRTFDKSGDPCCQNIEPPDTPDSSQYTSDSSQEMSSQDTE